MKQIGFVLLLIIGSVSFAQLTSGPTDPKVAIVHAEYQIIDQVILLQAAIEFEMQRSNLTVDEARAVFLDENGEIDVNRCIERLILNQVEIPGVHFGQILTVAPAVSTPLPVKQSLMRPPNNCPREPTDPKCHRPLSA